jgi:endonuclease-3 related protein
MDAKKLMHIHRTLKKRFDQDTWWPHETPFEVMVGAILTQQTVWKNVDRAIANLKRAGLMDPRALASAPIRNIEDCVRPSGFYKQKAERIRHLAGYLSDNYQGDIEKFFEREIEQVRHELLSLSGIGPETADSMLLYAGSKPKFVVDAYTFRIFTRLGMDFQRKYDRAQAFFEERLPRDAEVYKNFHAYLVELAKNYCRPKPQCEDCPLNDRCEYPEKSA